MAKNNLTLFLTISCLLVIAVKAYNKNSNADYWCIARNDVPADQVQAALDYYCSQIDCGPLQPGGVCWFPDTLQSHANFAFNQYFIQTSRCSYLLGKVTSTDPSYSGCNYPIIGTGGS